MHRKTDLASTFGGFTAGAGFPGLLTKDGALGRSEMGYQESDVSEFLVRLSEKRLSVRVVMILIQT
jgi:hypothetical protein